MISHDDYWTYICRYSHYYYLLLLAVTVLMVLNLFPLVFAEPGSGSFALSLVSMGFFLLTAACIVVLLWTCNRM